MNWPGSLRKRMDHPGQVLVSDVLNGHATIFGREILKIKISDISSQTLYVLGIPSGGASSSLVLCCIHTQQLGVEIELNAH